MLTDEIDGDIMTNRKKLEIIYGKLRVTYLFLK